LPQAKRDLAKLSITTPAQMELPIPPGIRCNVTTVVRRDDDGIERNRVKTFDVIGIDTPKADPFAPKDGGEPSTGGPTS